MERSHKAARGRGRSAGSHSGATSEPGRPVPGARELLRQLRRARSDFGATAEARKRELLQQFAGVRLATAPQLTAYHEDLLFLVAFPGEHETRSLALAELARVAQRCRHLSAAVRARLDNSGIAGTLTRPALAWPVARAFADEAIDLDWRNLEDPGAFDTLLGRLISPAEREAFEGGDYSARAWIALAKREDESDFNWLVREAAAARPLDDIATAWDGAQVPLRWSLHDSKRSITHARLSLRRPHLRTGFRRLAEPTATHVARPLPGIRRLERRDAAAVVDLARSALAARAREVHAMNYPNLDEVYRADLGEGVELMLIGVQPAQRLTLEANYGYLIVGNGVPVGYGGVSPLYRQANTGINIFDPFRGSEAAFLWAQCLRAFRTLFGVRRFVINGYQFGAGNDEAIASGAYWFYLRLGFRPSLAENVEVAAQEMEHLRRDPATRTPAAVLRRLARGDLHFDLADFDDRDFIDESLLTRIGAVLARRIAGLREPSHRDAERALIAQVRRDLGMRTRARPTRDGQPGFERLAPYAALLDVASWPRAERSALARWLAAKEAKAELEFAVQATRMTMFFDGLRTLAQEEAERADGRR